MSKQVPWNEEIYSTFAKLSMLSELEKEILRMRIMNYSISETSERLGVSESSIHRAIALLKKKYDNVQPISEGKLPPRRSSAQETWMDNH